MGGLGCVFASVFGLDGLGGPQRELIPARPLW